MLPSLLMSRVLSPHTGEWNFDRIISAHFGAPIGSTSPAEFRAAFGQLYGDGLKLEPEDWATLDGLNDLIETQKLGAPLRASYK